MTAMTKTPSLLRKKTIFFIAVVTTASMLCVTASTVYYFASTKSAAESGKPAFTTVLPKTKSAQDLGGWKRVSPPNNEPVFAYTDTVAGVAISVSQQPLPETFKSNSDGHINDLAKKFNATNKIDVNGTAVYIGTSAKGPQSVIFAKKSLLILIKSQNKIDDMSWAAYIASLT